MDARFRITALGLLVGGTLLLAACTASTAGTGTGDTSTVPPSTSPAASEMQTISGSVIGRDESQTYTMTAPLDWSSYKNAFTVKDSGVDVMGVSVWDVGKVPLDPCQWKGTFRTPGPSVDDLVGLLETEKERNASTPVDTLLDGFRGRYLEWSTPANREVTGDSDFTGCDTVGGHNDYVGWLGNGSGERYSIVAGQIDRMWALDVHGRTYLVDAIYSPDATKAQISEMMGVVNSLNFN